MTPRLEMEIGERAVIRVCPTVGSGDGRADGTIIVGVKTDNNQPPPASGALPPLIVVAGPTGVGKTDLGVELSKRFDGEVVSADSRYLYQGLDIGVAKPSPRERQGIPHHLIDIVPPDGEVTLATYQELVMRAIAAIQARGRLPLLVGGTPLYLNAIVEGWRIPRVPPDPAFRAEVEAEAAAKGADRVIARLRAVDPISADQANGNLRRVIRALEIFEATGIPKSELARKGPRPFATLEIELTMPRDQLYRAIDRRVDQQIARGLVDEVRALVEGELPADAPAMTSIGYRQLLPYLAGTISLPAAIAQIKNDTHRYVRHQQTWLRRNQCAIRVDVTRAGWIDRVDRLVVAFLNAR
ncbi:MAG: tRNA (adenosine(37)-N6)-dimethylallyltransferase MiaA [Chloroflexota bacterium]|nr:tRNA (adenosine(37)-N6)-dimethylallyltransferase MiaA [Chloroflexota bacterium]